jgi:hypothetical protein
VSQVLQFLERVSKAFRSFYEVERDASDLHIKKPLGCLRFGTGHTIAIANCPIV